MPIFNKNPHKNPKISYLGTNFILLILTFYVIVLLFPFVAEDPLDKYFEPFLVFIAIWYLCGIIFKKYVSYLRRPLKEVLRGIINADLLAAFMSFVVINFIPHLNLSPNLLFAFALVLFLLETIIALTFYAFRYAIDIEQYVDVVDISEHDTVLQAPFTVDDEIQARIEKNIVTESGIAAFRALENNVELFSSNTLVLSTSKAFNMNSLRNNRYSTLINLRRVNDIRGINELFIAVYDRLPYHGLFVGCFKSKSAHKKSFLDSYPVGLNYLLYTLNYFVKRILPKLKFSRELYFWFTGGKKRILSKAEVFGRLYCCGFEIENEMKVGDLIYFVAIKSKKPNRNPVITYGPIIKLNRVGKNGKLIQVFKFRTMHPFSEFLQSYIYDKGNLQEGGKFNHDIRINTVGAFMRKYWIDELPMLLNWIKGELKLVGVRPISKHYFSLYSEELQEKRANVKPGLLPPFYADMPKTLEEIELSELKYIDACNKNGVFKTDLHYFGLIISNILLRKARSK